MTRRIDRRWFLQAAAAGAAGLVLGRRARAGDVNGKLRVAAVGTGNRAGLDLKQVAGSPRVEIVALCDVDQSEKHLGWAAEKFPRAARYADFRRLLDNHQEFDALVVGTPDHMHAPVALPAMELGKHILCEKPLTHTVAEARWMRAAAERYGLVTQMGNQIQSRREYRTAVTLVRDGAIGRVREVRAWQAGEPDWRLVDRRPPGADPVPATLDWDLWLGVAPERPFKERLYHPKNWRNWQDFSNNQLGDFGCHILDPVFLALGLGPPISVEAEAPAMDDDVWATWCDVEYRFAGTRRTAGNELRLTWRDGVGRKPDREGLRLPDEYELPAAGSALIGEAGTLVIPHVDAPRLFPEEKFRDYPMPELEDVNHYTSWVDACLGDGRTTSPFDYAGPLTEAVLLGVIATHFPGEQLLWDADSMSFTHHADATARLSKEYRRGWAVGPG